MRTATFHYKGGRYSGPVKVIDTKPQWSSDENCYLVKMLDPPHKEIWIAHDELT